MLLQITRKKVHCRYLHSWKQSASVLWNVC